MSGKLTSCGGHELRLHRQMAQVSRLSLLGEMTAGLAHELNQPLAAIANFGAACERMMAAPAADLEPVRETVRQIIAQALRAGEVLHRLRRLAEAPDTEHSPADANALVEEILALAALDSAPQAIRLSFEPARSLPPVLVDGIQIQHVVLSLIHNAVEALAEELPREGSITVRTRLNDGQVEIEVGDTGPGVAPGNVEHLFEPFFTTRPHGTGLGLTGCRSILAAHEGSLDYEPNEPRGARFILRLPPAPAEPG